MLQGSLEVKARWKVAVVTARFNWDITGRLEEGAVARLRELGFAEAQITRVRVPGAFEIPLAARLLIDRAHDAVIALGAVIQGETKHFDYVCRAVEGGCGRVMLDTGRPVIFGVLTTDDEAQALDRVGGRHGHKGRDAAEAAVEMLNLAEDV